MTTTTHDRVPPDDDEILMTLVTNDGVETLRVPSVEAARRDRINRALQALVAEKLPLGSPEALERLRLAGAEPDLLVKLIAEHNDQWPEVSSAQLFEQYERELQDRPWMLKDLRTARGPFVERFPTVPASWPPIRDWLNELYPGATGRTKRNRFDSLNGLFVYAVTVLRALPFNPLQGTRRPEATSRKATPLSLELLTRLHHRAMQGPLRDQAVWLLRFALGWRPIELRRLLTGDVRAALAKADGFIMREQKHRNRKADRSPSPILPEVLEVLRELVDTMPDLPDGEPIFRSERSRYKGRPLGDQGIRGVIRRLFVQEGVRDEVPDAIPYDLRDSFATHVGRAVRARGGRTGEARDTVRRLLGHGDGGDPLSRYYDDDERHVDLADYSPLRRVTAINEGPSAENEGSDLEARDSAGVSGGNRTLDLQGHNLAS